MAKKIKQGQTYFGAQVNLLTGEVNVYSKFVTEVTRDTVYYKLGGRHSYLAEDIYYVPKEVFLSGVFGSYNTAMRKGKLQAALDLNNKKLQEYVSKYKQANGIKT